MSRTKSLHVILDDREAGIVREDTSGRYNFSYSDEYVDDPYATPLSISMPKDGRQFSDRTIRPFLDGLLPGNDDVREDWGKRAQVSARNPFALLAHYGEDCAGAAQFIRPDRVDRRGESGIDWLTDDEVAAIVNGLRTDPNTWQQQGPLRGGHFSLAGAQPKVALHRAGGRWGRPFGRTPTTHILKIGLTSIADHDIVEQLCLRTAQLVGLPTADCTIELFGEHRVAVVKRFDRLTIDGVMRRVHSEDLCQAFAIPPRQKYEADGGPTAAQIIDLLRVSVSPFSIAENDVDNFIAAMAFNWLIAGTDAHAKNYSLLLGGNSVRLAPLYDVMSVLCHPGLAARDRELAMKVGGERRLGSVARRHWERAAPSWGRQPDQLIQTILNLSARVPDAMSAATAELTAAIGRQPIAAQLLDAVTHHVGIRSNIVSS